MTKATNRQVEVLQVMAAWQRTYGTWPTFRDLMRQLGISSPSGIRGHFKLLAAKGLVTNMEFGRTRYTALTDAGWHAVGLMSPAELEAAAERLNELIGPERWRSEKYDEIVTHGNARRNLPKV